MSWYLIPLTFKANNPVHIGAGTLGFINLTRYYIPSKPLWGALTVNLAKKSGRTCTTELFGDYGQFVKENIRFSYFYPAICINGGWEIYEPIFCEEGLRYGSLKKEEFEAIFVRSYRSTALDNISAGAAEGTLHEVEFLLNRIKDPKTGLYYPVYFKGAIYINSEDGENIGKNKIKITISDLLESISFILIGGDLCYGLGELSLINNVDKEELCSEGLNLVFPCSGVLKAHTLFRADIAFSGDVEPIVSRNWHREKGPGRELSYEGTFFTPGTLINREELKVKVSDFGFWEII